MATIQVFDETYGVSYNISFSVENSVVYQSGVGSPQYYIKCSTTQKTLTDDTTVPAEIVLDLLAPAFDVTTDLRHRAVIIMDAVAGGAYLSTSSESTASSISSISSSSLSSFSVSSESSPSSP